MSQVRQNYNSECEAAINKQINMELYACYVYQSMQFYFERDDVALLGFSKFFGKASAEERGHAELLMKYQNQRGGRIVLQDIKKPEVDEWGAAVDAMKAALALERQVNQALLDLHAIANKHEDANLADFLEGTFLEEQVTSIKSLADHVTNLARVGAGVGEYLYDKDL